MALDRHSNTSAPKTHLQKGITFCGLSCLDLSSEPVLSFALLVVCPLLLPVESLATCLLKQLRAMSLRVTEVVAVATLSAQKRRADHLTVRCIPDEVGGELPLSLACFLADSTEGSARSAARSRTNSEARHFICVGFL